MISPHLSSQTIITPKTITKSHTIHNSVASTQPINTSPSTTAHPIKTPPSTHTIKTSPSTTSHPIKTSPATSQPHPLQRPHPPKRKRDSPKNTPSISFLLNSPPQKHQKLTPSKPQTSFQNLPSSMLPLSQSVTW
ncbi:hypothetical protein BC829DRAFT_405202 [Chytridium lagenaria]|nr:hypothetical protein BC829DRAFT_405202 [Chytridium lagenaria]